MDKTGPAMAGKTKIDHVTVSCNEPLPKLGDRVLTALAEKAFLLQRVKRIPSAKTGRLPDTTREHRSDRYVRDFHAPGR